MSMYYELHEVGGPVHELEFENICDIQVCLDRIYKLKQERKQALITGDYTKIKEIVDCLPNIDCLAETIQKMSKVSVPEGTDY